MMPNSDGLVLVVNGKVFKTSLSKRAYTSTSPFSKLSYYVSLTPIMYKYRHCDISWWLRKRTTVHAVCAPPRCPDNTGGTPGRLGWWVLR